MDMDCAGHAPILGALYHAPGAIARHDAVAWGYGRGADRRGAEIHQNTEVLGIELEDTGSGPRVTGVRTNRGRIATRKVLCAVAGSTPRLLQMVGAALADLRYIRCRPWCPSRSSRGSTRSSSRHRCTCMSARARVASWSWARRSIPYELHSTRSTLDFAEGLAAHMLELFPFLSDVKIIRQWAGMADMTPDFAPIMGLTPVQGFYLDSGWGTWGFKATPVCGKTMSHTVARNEPHPLIQGFGFDRFARYSPHGREGRGVGGSLSGAT